MLLCVMSKIVWILYLINILFNIFNILFNKNIIANNSLNNKSQIIVNLVYNNYILSPNFSSRNSWPDLLYIYNRLYCFISSYDKHLDMSIFTTQLIPVGILTNFI